MTPLHLPRHPSLQAHLGTVGTRRSIGPFCTQTSRGICPWSTQASRGVCPRSTQASCGLCSRSAQASRGNCTCRSSETFGTRTSAHRCSQDCGRNYRRRCTCTSPNRASQAWRCRSRRHSSQNPALNDSGRDNSASEGNRASRRHSAVGSANRSPDHSGNHRWIRRRGRGREFYHDLGARILALVAALAALAFQVMTAKSWVDTTTPEPREWAQYFEL